jgi:ATP-binding cassette subfamily B protein
LNVAQKRTRRGIGGLRTLLPYLRRHAVALVAGFGFMLVQNFGYVRIPAYFQKILDEVVGANRSDTIGGLIGAACLYIVATMISLYLMRRLIIGVSRKIEYGLRRRIYDKLLELDYPFFQTRETGDLVSRTTNDLDDVRTLLGPGIMYIPNSLSLLFIAIPVLVRLNGPLMLLVAGALGSVIVLVFLVSPKMRPLYRGIQEATGRINSRVWQIVSGITTVKLYTMESREVERFGGLSRDFLKRNMATVRIQEVLWPSFTAIFGVTQLLILLVGGRMVAQGSMTLGQLLQFNVMIGTLTFPVLSLGWIMSLLQQGISAMTRINEILDEPVESRADWKAPGSGQIGFQIKDLTFTHRGQTVPALKNLSLTINPGQLIGLTGTIGAGKSTLVNVLTGLLKPPRGTVFVNDIDIRDIEPESLFKRVGIVSQSPFLFSRTLSENIAMGRDGTAARISEVVELAGLTHDVTSFPDGLKQLVGERGITLSGGQKQRTAIARALMKNSPVVILDDALSSVDSRTEASIIKNLRSLKGRKTLIIVSHRIAPLSEADWIYVLDDGRIVQEGTHGGLLAAGGLYARLARLQQLEGSVRGSGPEEGETG